MSNPVSIRLDEDTRSRLEDAARRQDRSLSYVAQKAIVAWLDGEDRRSREIADAAAAFESETRFVSGESVSAWVDSWTDDPDAPPPRPDVVVRKKR